MENFKAGLFALGDPEKGLGLPIPTKGLVVAGAAVAAPCSRTVATKHQLRPRKWPSASKLSTDPPRRS